MYQRLSLRNGQQFLSDSLIFVLCTLCFVLCLLNERCFFKAQSSKVLKFLPTAYCLLPTALCLLPSAYCLLPTAFCLLIFRHHFFPGAKQLAHFTLLRH